MSAQVHGQSAAAIAPVSMTGYNTFGDPAESEDANGNVTVSAYDADSRATSMET